VTDWPSTKARRVLAALLGIGRPVKRQSGSHKVLVRDGCPDLVFAFRDGDETGPRMLARRARCSGLRPEDL
jgi:predicted RNA binding protein YcfA (HicA-like mRNA interferase family)